MPLVRRAWPVVIAVALSTWPRTAWCQPADLGSVEQEQVSSAPPLSADAYVPITSAQRVQWAVDGTVGPHSLFVVGPLAAAWQTAWNTPE